VVTFVAGFRVTVLVVDRREGAHQLAWVGSPVATTVGSVTDDHTPASKPSCTRRSGMPPWAELALIGTNIAVGTGPG